jgi:hypothetical protein
MLPMRLGSRLVLLYRIVPLTIFFLLVLIASVLAKGPVEVNVGLKVNQITGIDQKAENFGAVVTMIMEWNEPALAVPPGKQAPQETMYEGANFIRLMSERELLWPVISFYNVQGRVAYQNRVVVVDHTGKVRYFARFTATFQAPDFDFSHFPLDHQGFYLKLDSLRPLDQVVFKSIPGFSGLGNSLGEEEWILENAHSEVTTHTELEFAASRFVLSFSGVRHLNYYVVRILIPILIIILVSWFTFFLKDYSKRIDLASGNLLLFIAFNFTIANDLPRLGYLTLMDTFLLAAFTITGFVVLANVMLRRLQRNGRDALANKLDILGIWGYPLIYLGGGLLMVLLFYR